MNKITSLASTSELSLQLVSDRRQTFEEPGAKILSNSLGLLLLLRCENLPYLGPHFLSLYRGVFHRGLVLLRKGSYIRFIDTRAPS